jgi:branched-chain amino acid transport system permease protein
VDVGTLTQQLVNAMTLGAIYALVALGYTMVYGIIELINFAHGDVFMAGSFVSLWILTDFLGFKGPIHNIPELAAVLVVSFLFTMVVMGLVGVIIERFAYRRLRNAPRLAPLITAIGVSFIIQNVIQIWRGPAELNSPQLIDVQAGFYVGTAFVRWISVFVISLALGLMIALKVFVSRTRLGRAMRSTALDREAAQLMGVDINTTIALTFFIGSALAGAAGVVQGLYYGYTFFTIGFQGGLKAFTAAVLGGIGNTTGAALGGFTIGFIEVFTSQAGYANWSEAIVFSILILVLVFRPTGLLGQAQTERA